MIFRYEHRKINLVEDFQLANNSMCGYVSELFSYVTTFMHASQYWQWLFVSKSEFNYDLIQICKDFVVSGWIHSLRDQRETLVCVPVRSQLNVSCIQCVVTSSRSQCPTVPRAGPLIGMVRNPVFSCRKTFYFWMLLAYFTYLLLLKKKIIFSVTYINFICIRKTLQVSY